MLSRALLLVAIVATLTGCPPGPSAIGHAQSPRYVATATP